MMLRLRGVLLLILLCCWSQATAQDRGLGLGVLVGEPTGLSAKFWLGPTSAIDAAAAWSFTGENRFQLHVDYLAHFFHLFPVPKGTLPLYFGGGGRLELDDDPQFGIRVPVGLAYLFPNIPLDIFAEIGPVVHLAPETGFALTGAIGVRYFFR